MSIELPVTSRHRRDMTERLLKVTLSPNQTNKQNKSWYSVSTLSFNSFLHPPLHHHPFIFFISLSFPGLALLFILSLRPIKLDVSLTFTILVANLAGDKLVIFFLLFFNGKHDLTFHANCLHSGKNKKTISKCHLLKLLPGPKNITQLSMKISLLINMKMQTKVGIFIFISREIFMLSYV